MYVWFTFYNHCMVRHALSLSLPPIYLNTIFDLDSVQLGPNETLNIFFSWFGRMKQFHDFLKTDTMNAISKTL